MVKTWKTMFLLTMASYISSMNKHEAKKKRKAHLIKSEICIQRKIIPRKKATRKHWHGRLHDYLSAKPKVCSLQKLASQKTHGSPGQIRLRKRLDKWMKFRVSSISKFQFIASENCASHLVCIWPWNWYIVFVLNHFVVLGNYYSTCI